jgi:transcriptional regulator
MYNPAHFVEDRPEVLRTFIERHPLAILTTCSPEGPQATHVPVKFHPEVGAKGVLRCHLARPNEHWKAIAEGAPVLAIFAGEEHYITPKWYPSTSEHGKVVPTWNYITVHARGVGRAMSATELLEHLHSLTDTHEAYLEEPWSVESAPADFITTMTKAIVGIEISITSLQGKWKVSQNRNSADRAGVVAGLTALNTSASVKMAAAVFDATNKKT